MDVKRLESKLKLCPSSFDIEEDLQTLPIRYVRTRRDKLQRDMTSNPHFTGFEKCRDWNAMCVFCFVLEDIDLALEYNRRTRELCPDDIVALVDHANILFRKQENFERISDICNKVNVLRESTWLLLSAKAEIAYCLSKVGMPCYGKAIRILREILKDTAIQDFYKNDNYMEEISDWIFMLANMEKRPLNIHNSQNEAFSQVSRQKYEDVSRLFARIIRQGPSSSLTLKRLKARSYVELGFLVYGAEKNQIVFPNGLKDLLPEHEDLWMQSKAYFEKALELCRDDRYVLERSGKYFRYAKDIDKSVLLLRCALEVEETAFAHHHLALSLKRQLEFQSSTATDNVGFRDTRVSLHIQNDKRSSKLESGKSGYQKGPHFPFTDQQQHRQGGTITMQTSPGMYGKKFNQGASRNVLRQDYHATLQSTQQRTPDVSDRFGKMSISRNSPAGYSGRGNSKESRIKSATPIFYDRENRNSGYNCRNKNRFKSQVENKDSRRTREQHAIKMLIKSPQRLKTIDKSTDGKTIAEVFFHLDKAYELSDSCTPLYDQGLFLRGLQETQRALLVFKKIFENTTKQVTPMYLANAYEQAGLCLYDILLEKQQLDADRLETDMKTYFRLSIEISSGIAEKIPFLKGCWESAPTLTSILLGNPETGEKEKDRLKLLAFVYDKVENYSVAIAVLQKLLEMAGDGREEANILLDIARQCWKGGKHDDAVLALMLCAYSTPTGRFIVDDDLFLNIFTDGCFAALKAGNRRIARDRILRALCFSIDRNTEPEANIEDIEDSNLDKSDAEFDIFILCDDDNEDECDKLRSVLRKFEITATVNTQDGLPGNPDLKIMENFVRKAKHVIVLYNRVPKNPKLFAMHFASIQQLTNGSILVVTSRTAPEVPSILAGCNSVEFDFDSELPEDDEDFLQDDALCSKVKEIIFQLSVKTS